jgi:hypothetical protein
MVAGIVFILCAVTSCVCFLLLMRAFVQTKARLLLWSAFCFLGIAINNALLYVDIKVLPDVDLSLVRTIPALAGIVCLIYGLIRDSA